MTSYGWPLSEIVRPMVVGSPPKRRARSRCPGPRRGGVGQILFRSESAADHRCGAEQAEEVGTHIARRHLFGLSLPR